MPSFIFLTFLVLFTILLQSTVLAEIAVDGVKPDLILIWVVMLSLLQGSRRGAAFGLLSGLLLDIVASRYVGLNALALFITGLVFGQLEGKVFKENYLVPIAAVFVGTIFHGLLLTGLAQLAGRPPYLGGLRNLLLYAAAYNTILVPFLYGKFYRAATKGIISQVE